MPRNIKCIICLLAAAVFVSLAGAQSVGIGTNMPNESAILDIQSTTKGLLIPRHTTTQMLNISNPENGLLLYNTSTNRLFYNIGTKALPEWIRLITDADFSINNFWLLNGNAGTNANNDFIGTTNSTDLLFKVNNKDVVKIKATNNSVYLGEYAGKLNSTGEGNVGIGNQALQNATTAGNQVAIGENALKNYTGTNGQNTAIGSNALLNCTTCTQTIAIGNFALQNSSGAADANVAIGHYALELATTNSRNTAVGYTALKGLNAGNNNVAVGYAAGKINGSGNFNSANNTFFGSETRIVDGVSNCTLIGYLAEAINSNTMAFGNDEVKQWMFGITTPTSSSRIIEVGSTFANGNGAYLNTAGFWTNVSDSTKKKAITRIDKASLLNSINALPVTQWRYKGSSDWHIGPMAQDFKALFNLGDDDKAITTVDASGVALAAIQQLMQENEWLEERIKRLEKKQENIAAIHLK